MHTFSVPAQRLDGGDRARVWRSGITVTTLHRQVVREVLQVFLVTLAATTGLMIVVGVVQQLLSIGATAELMMELMPYFVPVMLPFVIPSALLFSVIIVYGRMGADSELTAAKAAGINVLSLLAPSFVLGGALAIATFLLTDRAVPWAARQIQGAVIAYASDLLIQQLDSTGHVQNGPGGMRITVAGMEGSQLIRPLIRFRGAGGREYSVSAATANFQIDRKEGAVALRVQDAAVYTFRQSSSTPDQAFLRGEQTIQLPFVTSNSLTKSHHLPAAVIQQRIRKQERTARKRLQALTRSGGDAAAIEDDWLLRDARRAQRNLRTELHSRYALAYGSFGFALFGSALAALQASGRILSNILFCFMPVVGAYYTLELGIAAQCKSGHLDPAWSMWIGNVVLTGLGLQLVRNLTRR